MGEAQIRSLVCIQHTLHGSVVSGPGVGAGAVWYLAGLAVAHVLGCYMMHEVQRVHDARAEQVPTPLHSLPLLGSLFARKCAAVYVDWVRSM